MCISIMIIADFVLKRQQTAESRYCGSYVLILGESDVSEIEERARSESLRAMSNRLPLIL